MKVVVSEGTRNAECGMRIEDEAQELSPASAIRIPAFFYS
jgi:hypothetical protein